LTVTRQPFLVVVEAAHARDDHQTYQAICDKPA